mgnify:CR=1 FL=1
MYLNDFEGKITKFNLTNMENDGAGKNIKLYDSTILLNIKADRNNGRYQYHSMDAGIGKTTSALALARELFGDLWKHNLHELNASDERGIDVVRGKIKEFARTAPLVASLSDTAPEDTLKSPLSKDARPFVEVDASFSAVF